MRNYAALFSVVILAMASLNAKADDLDNIHKAGVVRVGIALELPPFGYIDADRNPAGLDVELAHKVADTLGVKLQIQPVTTPNRIPYLLSGKVDIIIANLGETPERAKQVLYTFPYVNTYIGVWGPKKIHVASAAELGDYVVAISRGSTPDLALSVENPSAKIMRTEDDSSAVAAYMSGQSDLLGSTDTQIAALVKQNPKVEFDPKFRIHDSPAHMAVRKGETRLANQLDDFIKARYKDGTLDALSQKYMSKPADIKID